MKGQTGVTLIELLVTLAVVAIVLTVGVPSFANFVRDNELATTSNNLVATITRARSEAIDEGASVVVCSSNNGNGCTGSNWEAGWIIFRDDNGNGSREASETIIDTSDGSDALTIRGKATGSLSSNSFTYADDGFLRGDGDLSLVICGERGADHARAVNISNTGRARQAPDADGNGTVENTEGNDVSCP